MQDGIIKEAKKYVHKILKPLNDHFYHSYKHAIDVMQRSAYLARKEGLSDDETEMLALAGLFHDTGFTVRYDKNEPIGAEIAEKYLKKFSYPTEKIKTIKRIILATDPDYKNPKDIYEKIIKDADLDNLGREDFLEKSNDIKKEIESIKKIKIKEIEWHKTLIELLTDYEFNTNVQQKERDYRKKENLSKLFGNGINNGIKVDKELKKYLYI